MNILVLGAGGFVGSAIYTELRGNSFKVTPSVHRISSLASIAEYKWDSIDNTNLDSVTAENLVGYDVIVHAVLSEYSNYSNQLDLLFDCAVEAGVKHLVYISTIDVYDSSTVAKKSVNANLVKNGDIYGDTKIDAELRLQNKMTSASNLKVTILRPGIIYGPKSKLWSGNIIRRQKAGHWIDINAKGIANLTYIGDLAKTVRFCIEHSDYGIFNVIGDSMRWSNFLLDHNRIVTKNLNFTTHSPISGQKLTNIARDVAKKVFKKYRNKIMYLYTSRPLVRKLMKQFIDRLENTPSDIENNVLNYPAYIENDVKEIYGGYTKTKDGLEMTREWYVSIGLIE